MRFQLTTTKMREYPNEFDRDINQFKIVEKYKDIKYKPVEKYYEIEINSLEDLCGLIYFDEFSHQIPLIIKKDEDHILYKDNDDIPKYIIEIYNDYRE